MDASETPPAWRMHGARFMICMSRMFETMMKYIEGTAICTGLRVKAILKRGGNELGERVSNEEMRALRIESHAVCPAWNYTISPRHRSSDKIEQLVCCRVQRINIDAQDIKTVLY